MSIDFFRPKFAGLGPLYGMEAGVELRGWYWAGLAPSWKALFRLS